MDNEAINIPCPKCGQEAGSWCRNKWGARYQADIDNTNRNVPALHRERRLAYAKKLQEETA